MCQIWHIGQVKVKLRSYKGRYLILVRQIFCTAVVWRRDIWVVFGKELQYGVVRKGHMEIFGLF